MPIPLLNERDLEFVLYEFLDASALTRWARFKEHNQETFDATLNTARQLAERYFANHNRKADLNEPRLVDGQVEMIPEVKQALDQFAEAGFLVAHHDQQLGGMQLPWLITQACFGYFQAANIATAAYPFLTIAAANLLHNFATQEQQTLYLPPMLSGRFFGTMALSEPQAGSSLADVRTQAIANPDGSYSMKGNKMWISGGEHELAENIIHLVLARIQGAPAGVKGLSLFIVPRYRVNQDGSVGESNDISLVGLNHKMGYRGTVNTALSLGDNHRCIGYRIGKPNQGLSIMFQMMNETRIGVGMGAVMLGYAGYLHSLDYARNRPQGRLPENKDPTQTPVRLIQHADIKRLLLAQKTIVEGGFALGLYCARLVDQGANADTEREQQDAQLLLELLTPIIKAWCSDYTLKANDHAIQILGGYGYTRDFPLEQFYRDNRLNPIHEGSNGIQAIDLMGRKVWNGAAIACLKQEIRAAIVAARGVVDDELRQAFRLTWDQFESLLATLNRLRDSVGANVLLANASLLMDLLGRIVMAWIWLRQATIARQRIMADTPTALTDAELAFYRGKLKACQYYFSYELPRTHYLTTLLARLDTNCLDMAEDWF